MLSLWELFKALYKAMCETHRKREPCAVSSSSDGWVGASLLIFSPEGEPQVLGSAGSVLQPQCCGDTTWGQAFPTPSPNSCCGREVQDQALPRAVPVCRAKEVTEEKEATCFFPMGLAGLISFYHTFPRCHGVGKHLVTHSNCIEQLGCHPALPEAQ